MDVFRLIDDDQLFKLKKSQTTTQIKNTINKLPDQRFHYLSDKNEQSSNLHIAPLVKH